MFFIVSTGRSGTTAIARTLSLIHGCICKHEPAPELIAESSAYRYGTISADEIREILLKTRKPIVRGSVYCESNQTLSLIIPVVREAFPQARYLWLLRNGLDVVASAYQKQWYTGHSENHDRYEDCPPLQKAWIDGRIVGDRSGDMSAEAWEQLDRFGRCCWYWSYVNRIIEEDLKAYAPQDYKTLRLEDLDFELANILRWMGLKVAIVPKVKRHNAAKRTPYHWSQWSPHERETFEFWCGDLMDRFYPTWRTATGEWQDIEYRSRSGLLTGLARDYDFVKRANALLAQNKNKAVSSQAT